jgi:hypothetical protein
LPAPKSTFDATSAGRKDLYSLEHVILPGFGGKLTVFQRFDRPKRGTSFLRIMTIRMGKNLTQGKLVSSRCQDVFDPADKNAGDWR